MEFSYGLGGKDPHFPDIQYLAESWGMSTKGKDVDSHAISFWCLTVSMNFSFCSNHLMRIS